MQGPRRDWVLGGIFLALGLLALVLALTNDRIILGTGLCLALAAMFFARARRGGR
ncbi:MAG: hypothetical protein RLZZ387_1968 [Chloroflexota bacterium]|jgi:hypothetical protein